MLKLIIISLISLQGQDFLAFSKITLKDKVVSDYSEFYTSKNGLFFLSSFFVSGVFANSKIDQSLSDYYQVKISSNFTNTFSSYVKLFGYTKTAIALFGSFFIFQALGKATRGSFLYKFSDRVGRMLLVGTPPLLLTSLVLGGSRPNSRDPHSRWLFFQNTNRVSASGHSFFGALPFLALASITESLFWKSFLFFSSTLTALSRLNDNKHYLSQIILGWSFAYLSYKAVTRSSSHLNLSFNVSPSQISLGFRHTF